MTMYNLIEYSDNYSKTTRSYSEFCRYEPNITMKGSKSFKFKVTIKKNPLMMVPMPCTI